MTDAISIRASEVFVPVVKMMIALLIVFVHAIVAFCGRGLSMRCFACLFAVVSVGSAQDFSVPSGFQVPRAELVGKPVPKWRGALFIPTGNEQVDMPHLNSYARTGEGRTLQLKTADSARVIIKDVAADPSGTVAVAAVIWNTSGQRASVLAFIDSRGNTTIVRRTNPFEIHNIAFDSQGRIWAFGQNIADSASIELQSDHAVFHVFRRDGTDDRAYVRSSFVSRKRLISVGGGSRGETELLASRDSILLYLAELGQITEVATTGDVLWQSVIPLPSVEVGGSVYTLSPRRLALTSSNRLFGYFINGHAPGYRGLGYYELDRAAHTWRSVPSLNDGNQSMLWGAEGEFLLVSDKGAPGFNSYRWVTAPPEF